MNSLLKFENLGGQVQMIYVDPPYGVKFGSNFQPFVRKRDVSHGDDEDMTREPEMVQAYRDTWELGLHSYLTYMRDRFRLAKELLHPSGSIFVQISDENLHHVRELMDETFGAENFSGVITFAKTAALAGEGLSSNYDYLLWYAKDKSRVKYRQLYVEKIERTELGTYTWIELPDGKSRRLTQAELKGEAEMPASRRFRADNITGQGETESGSFDFEFEGRVYRPSKGRHWSTNLEGMNALRKANRIVAQGNSLAYKRYENDFPVMPITHVWNDTIIGTFSEKSYVVQTGTLAIQRCLLMTTDPGDLVVDPTCGSGTTASVAEQWGRRWITMDTSRVPLALARQRLLTATFDYCEIRAGGTAASPSPAVQTNAERTPGPASLPNNPAAGFVYKRKQNAKGEEIGGIVPHITLKSIANNEPPEEEVLVDRPEIKPGIVRVCGPFTVEATIPTPVDFEGDGVEDSGAGAAEEHGHFVSRMIEVLRRNPVLRLGGNRSVTLRQVRPPARTLSLHAEALVEKLTVVSSQLSEGEADEKGFSGAGGLAKGHGVGDGRLPGEPGVSQGGDVWPDQPASAGGGVHSQQHRRGASESESGGVSAGAGVREGVAGRTGDTGAGGAESRLSASPAGQPASGTTGGGGASAQRSDSFATGPTTDNRQLTTSLSPSFSARKTAR